MRKSIEGGGKCDTMKGKPDEDHNEGNKGKKSTQETERENVLSSNTPNLEKFSVQKVWESFIIFVPFFLVPLLSQLTHFFSIFFPVLILVGVPIFSIFFFRRLIVLMFLSMSRRLGLKRESRETVRKLGKEGHN